MGSVSVTDAVLQITQPTAAAGKDWVRNVDLTDSPIQVDGGSFHTDVTDTTVIWEYVDEAKN